MNDNYFKRILVGCVRSMEQVERPEGTNALMFNFELNTHFYIDNLNTIRYLTEFQLIITIDSNYKKVFFRVIDPDDTFDENKLSNWEFTTDHDSCWSSDGFRFLTTHWFNHREKLLFDLENLKQNVRSIYEINSHEFD